MLENIKAGTSAARNKILFREAEEMQLVHHGGPEDHAAEIAFHNTSKGMRDENSAEALCHFPPPPPIITTFCFATSLFTHFS